MVGQSLHGTRSLRIQLYLLAGKPQESSCLCLPRVLITGAQFYMGAGNQPRFLMSVLQILRLLGQFPIPSDDF